MFPRAKAMLPKAIEAGVRIACGSDAPAIPHGQNAKELCALVDRGMTPDAGDPRRHGDQRRADRAPRTNSADSRPDISPTSSRCRAIRRATSASTLDVRFVMKDGRFTSGRSGPGLSVRGKMPHLAGGGVPVGLSVQPCASWGVPDAHGRTLAGG